EQVGVGALAAQRAGGERRYELLRGGGEDAAHRDRPLLQPANEIERLVGGNAAADDEKDASRCQHQPMRSGALPSRSYDRRSDRRAGRWRLAFPIMGSARAAINGQGGLA